jgi:hypothetical protein
MLIDIDSIPCSNPTGIPRREVFADQPEFITTINKLEMRKAQ